MAKKLKPATSNFPFTNCNFINREEKIKRHLEAGSTDVHGRMILARHKLKGIRNEYSETIQPSSKTAKLVPLRSYNITSYIGALGNMN